MFRKKDTAGWVILSRFANSVAASPQLAQGPITLRVHPILLTVA